ncbi:MAG: hypothetical protein QW734_04680 [Candidatus Bathyarchaeia archaeon]
MSTVEYLNKVIESARSLVKDAIALMFDKYRLKIDAYVKALDTYRKIDEKVTRTFRLGKAYVPAILTDTTYTSPQGAVTRSIPDVEQPYAVAEYQGDVMDIPRREEPSIEVPSVGQFVFEEVAVPTSRFVEELSNKQIAAVFTETPNRQPEPDLFHYGHMVYYLPVDNYSVLEETYPRVEGKYITFSTGRVVKIISARSTVAINYRRDVEIDFQSVAILFHVKNVKVKYAEVFCFYDPMSGQPVYVDRPGEIETVMTLIYAAYNPSARFKFYVWSGQVIEQGKWLMAIPVAGSWEIADVTEFFQSP